jgi:ubiquinone/menaquinone biosynthesis C-methylase UbiE
MDSWAVGTSYEPYVGRWSRLLAREFLSWLALPAGLRWLDVGCGTGALTETVLASDSLAEVVGVDPSGDFVGYAAAHARDPRASFVVGDAQALPAGDSSFDAVVSGLMLNFVPERGTALGEMRRVARGGGPVAAYVWDYPGEMQLMTYFWDTAAELDPAAGPRHEGARFPFCRPGPLAAMVTDAGFVDVEVEGVVVPTVFADFDDYWTPFLSGHAPAPAYAMSLGEDDRAALREALRSRLPTEDDGSIHLTARAWAVRGRCP